ncbi:ABC transporter substrate-binding protein [Pseudoroseicyclus aestuarii]|uniref:Peptide/nickel transport system substrate-binding protein n=1 Tax=Pseudoroseicyclus aestuarii TaxID=1795041 RepID=A0A318SUF3_9RHOB|nr:ABC transporter substrate-binding protein [Pseudoroseicyclus aestuarii]PYE82430.1 peptide/nickel transport system substrate-binding protein [Pseudoroseicyclus aestuarii]
MTRSISPGFLAGTSILAAALLPGLATAQERVLRLDESAVGEIDPAKGTDYADTVLAVNLYEPLVYPAQGEAGVQPWLASDWTIDGLTYEFTLRDGASFASGNPVTAGDVVWSFERLMAMGQGPASLFEGRVEGVEAVDDSTVRFTLTEPFAPFLSALVQLSVIDSTLAQEHLGEGPYGENGGYASDWISANSAGSGAYIIAEHDPQIETVLVPNPNYDGDPVDPAAPEQVTYRYSLEASTVRALMSRGEHDVTSQWLPPEVLKALNEEGGVHLETEPGGTGEYIMLNTRRAPLDDVNCRRALSLAYDYGTTLHLLTVTEGVAQGIPMSGPMPQGFYGSDPERRAPTQDMQAAQEALAECQYDPAEYPLDIAWIAEVPARERIALLMQATFSQLGFQVNVTRTPWALITQQVTDPETAPHAIEIAISARTPDPDSLAYNMFSSTLPPTWISSTYLADEEVDRLLEEGRSETDPEARAAIYDALSDRLRDLAPGIWAYEANPVYALRNGVSLPNLEQDDRRFAISGYGMLFKDAQIDG